MDVNAWLVATGATTAVLVGVALVVAAVTGTAIASWGRFPATVGMLVCAGVPVVGPLVLVGVALVRSGRADPRLTWLERGRWTVRGMPLVGRRVRLGLLAAGLIALVALLVVPVARLRAGAAFSSPVLLTALPAGGGLLTATFLAAVLVACLAARRTTRLGAVGGVVIGGFWVSLSAAVLLLSVPLTGVLHLADRFLGNTLASVVLEMLRSYRVPAADIAGDLRESVSTRLDAGAWIALIAGLLLMGWAVAEVIAARGAARRLAALSNASAAATLSVSVAPSPDAWSF